MPAADWGYQVVPYAGDGVAGRTIATDFPLNSGTVAVFIYPYGGADDDGCLRHSGMSGTILDGAGFSTLYTTVITGFTAAGFTLGLGSGGNTNFNAVGRNYLAIVLRDLTAGGDWMKVGSYVGTASSISSSTDDFPLVETRVNVANHGFIAGQSIFIEGHTPAALNGSWSVLRVNTAGQFVLATSGQGNGGASGTVLANTGAGATLVAVALGFSPTHLWIGGRSFTYRSTDFSGQDSILLNNDGSAAALTSRIRNLTADGFTVGPSNDVNDRGSGTTYYYVALRATTDLLAAGFFSFKATGTAGDDAVAYGFAPVYTIARRFATGSASAARWRSWCSHTGDDSQISGGGIDGAQGVRSMDVNGATFGSNVAPAASDFYGYGWKGDGVACGAVYDGFNLSDGFTSYDTFTHGTDSGGGVGCQPTFSPGTDSGGGSGCQVSL